MSVSAKWKELLLESFKKNSKDSPVFSEDGVARYGKAGHGRNSALDPRTGGAWQGRAWRGKAWAQ